MKRHLNDLSLKWKISIPAGAMVFMAALLTVAVAGGKDIDALTILLALISSAIATAMIFAITALALKPVHLIKEGIRASAGGDLTSRIHTGYRDEIGLIADSFNDVSGAFGKMIEQIASLTDKVVSITDLLKKSAESTVSETVAQTTQAQQIAVAAEEMSQTIADIARNAASAAQMSAEALLIAQEGRSTTENAVEQITQVQQSAQELSVVIKEVNIESEQISDILSLIDEIADQTNLLALNAAIEAARAGNAGKGFAVVADEVRKLAEKTAKATHDIVEKIARMKKITTQAEKTMLVTREKVERGTALVLEAGSALSRIVNSVEHARDQVAQIATAVEEQSAAAEEISQNISRTSQATIKVNSLAQKVVADVDTMVETAEQLMDSTCSFKTTGNPDNDFVAKAVETAGLISDAMQKALDSGQISMADLFDEHYSEIIGTAPQQYKTGYMSLLERILPSIQEPVLNFNRGVVFCAAVDRNGFLPVHNSEYSKTPRMGGNADDIAWNTANCRNRKFFKDRVGLAAARNQKSFLLRAYRRDMGTNFVQMKDVSAPIFVSGRHWGGLRIGYKVNDSVETCHISRKPIAEVRSLGIGKKKMAA